MAEAETRRAANGSPGGGVPDSSRQADGGRSAPKRSKRPFLILGALVLIGGLGGGTYWWLHRNQESTDDAFIDGNIVQISPQVSGKVVGMHMQDNELVAKGTLLVEIDPRDYQATVESAQANLDAAEAARQAAQADLSLTKASTDASIAQAEAGVSVAEHSVAEAEAEAAAAAADADRARADLPRVQSLFQRKFNSQQQLDNAQAAASTSQAKLVAAQKGIAMSQSQVAEAKARLAEARTAPQQVALKQAKLAQAAAQVEQAKAALDTARLDLSYTQIRAPQGGRVTKRAVNLGDVVKTDQILANLVVGQPWVTANFKETQLTRMRPGQPVSVSINSYPDRDFKARVDSIQAGTGSRFSLLPPENATGNFVKVVQRVPVKIVFDDPAALTSYMALGMSVEPTVDVAAAPEPAPHAAEAADGQ